MTSRGHSGDWIPLMDYAIRRGVSLSTLRRHIKANKIQYRVENGKYLLLDRPDEAAVNESGQQEAAALQAKLQKVETDLQKAQEEIAELKMLVALYEEKMAPQRLSS